MKLFCKFCKFNAIRAQSGEHCPIEHHLQQNALDYYWILLDMAELALLSPISYRPIFRIQIVPQIQLSCLAHLELNSFCWLKESFPPEQKIVCYFSARPLSTSGNFGPKLFAQRTIFRRAFWNWNTKPFSLNDSEGNRKILSLEGDKNIVRQASN